MEPRLPASAQRVQEVLEALGLTLDVREMPATTRTAREAATAIGCTVAHIAKSILFRGALTGKPILVVASGMNRVNEQRIAEHAGEPLERATPDFVREATGYAIGGVPPVGFAKPIETWIDEDLLHFGQVWAAAGTPFAVFCLDPKLLPSVTGGKAIKIT
jgi:prolyl-tRNA editing enzyme YbaK/EbsC (Cys-tRNA(Pro) deacylase)